MEGIITVKSPWPDWIIEKKTAQTKYETEYLASNSEGEKKTFSTIKLISIPYSQDDIDFAIRNGTSPEADCLSSYYQSVADSFVTEIKSVQGLGEHDNILRYDDCVIQKNGEIGYNIFLLTERLQPLSAYISGKNLTDSDIAAIGSDICSAISFCASKGIIHGDIKPSNIYVSGTGHFKLGNFGMHLLQKGNDSPNGATRAYMAPELDKQGAVFSENTDTYSLGLVLYWLLNNRQLPFISQSGNSSYQGIIERRLNGEQIPLPAEGSEVLRAMIMTAISYQPSNRFRSAEVFRTALNNYINNSRTGSLDTTQAAVGFPTVKNSQPEAGIVSQTPDFAQAPVRQAPTPYNTAAAPNAAYPSQSGLSQNPLQQYKMTHNNQKPKKNRAVAVILIVLGVVALLAISVLAALYFLGFFSGGTANDNDEAETSSEAVVISSAEDDYPEYSDSSDEETDESSDEESSDDDIIEPDTENVIPVKEATCSKHSGNGKYNRTYGAGMAVDGNPETCWMAYGKPAGKGNWIKIDFGKKTTVTGIKIINGNTWDGYYKGSFIDGYEELYEKNGRLRKYELEFSDGTKISGEAADENESDFSANIIYFDNPVETSYIKLYVKSGYKGYKYENNVCIGEIQAFC